MGPVAMERKCRIPTFDRVRGVNFVTISPRALVFFGRPEARWSRVPGKPSET